MPKTTNEIELLLSCKATGREQMEMFTAGMRDSETQANQLLGVLGRFATVGGVTMFAKKSIQAFSDLEETTSKFRVVFEGLEAQADAAVKKLTQSYGASVLSARQMLSGTGDLLTGFGFDKQTALELSEQAARLGSDLASFSNYAGGAEGATMALTKAMLGETEQAKMLGIVIRQDDEEYKKLFKEIKAQTGATDTQTKALVAMRLAYKQSPNAIGDFERTMSSIANRGRMLENELVMSYANIGEHLSGQFNALQGAGLGLLKTFNEMSPEGQRFAVITGEVAAGILAIKTADSLRALTSGIAAKASIGNTAALGAEAMAANTAAAAYGRLGASKRIASSIGGLLKTAGPMLAMGAAVAGIDALWNLDETAGNRVIREQEVKSNATISKNNERLAVLAQEMKMLEEYRNLANLSGRDQTQTNRLNSIATQLNKEYKDLNLSQIEGNSVLDITVDKYRKMVDLVKKRQDLEKQEIAGSSARAYEDQARAILIAIQSLSMEKAVIKDLWRNLTSFQITKPNMASSDIVEMARKTNLSDLGNLEALRNQALSDGLDKEAEKLSKIIELIKKVNDLRNKGVQEQQKAAAAATAEQIKALEKYDEHVRSTILSLQNSPQARFDSLVFEEDRLRKQQRLYTDENGNVKRDKDSVKQYYEIEKKLYDIRLQQHRAGAEWDRDIMNRLTRESNEMINLYRKLGGSTGQENIAKLQKEQLANYDKEIARLNDVMNSEKNSNEERLLAQGRLLELTKERGELEKTMAMEAFDAAQKRMEQQAKFSQDIFKLMTVIRSNTVDTIASNSIDALKVQGRDFSTDRWKSTALDLQKDAVNETKAIKNVLESFKSINAQVNTSLQDIINKLENIGIGTA